ncbi:MAG: hydrogenase maturation protein [Rhodospirillales bacterium]|nr:hydrogenase maturation protein [Rhodospirillales bacterium]
MRILLLCHSFNSLAQRVYVDLAARGHDLSVEFDIRDSVTEEAVALFAPDLVVAPFLKRAIPESVWRRVPCLVIHPGPPGDRGPSSLDRAILAGRSDWGVTILQANAEFDGGPIWASQPFALRPASKGSLYRREMTEAAIVALIEAIGRIEAGERPRPAPPGPLRPALRQAERAIDWQADDTETVLRKIRSADGAPGVADRIEGHDYFLFDALPADLAGPPGALLARAGDRVARATRDGAVWIGHLKPPGPESLKLPALRHLDQAASLPDLGFHDIGYQERGAVGLLSFPFHNGAMSTDQCRRLGDAFRAATRRPVKVILLQGGPDYWSNGIHLAAIEAAPSPADESWANINAIDDLAESILTATDQLVLAAIAGNAGAGGVFLALAADRVLAKPGVVLNPHYKGMGNLYGSEYWTYRLPKRTDSTQASRILEARLPMGAHEAKALGLVDEVPEGDFEKAALGAAQALAEAPDFAARLAAKRATRLADEAQKPLAAYRADELERMKLNFYGFDPSYHVARYNFMFKVPKSRTPLYLARHRHGTLGARKADAT